MKIQVKWVVNNQLVTKLISFLIFSYVGISPVTANMLSVVKSETNANDWPTIANRLKSMGVKYCVIPLEKVRNPADWGKQRVLFLPNVEKLTPVQAIALEKWTKQGGYLIASGAVGKLSPPGVRNIVRSLLGGYWGFNLNVTQQLQPKNIQIQDGNTPSALTGNVLGGVIIPNDPNHQAAIWDDQNRSTAVITTNRSTFFGWYWGKNTISNSQLDRDWLQAALNRYLKSPSNIQVQETFSCPWAIATPSKTPSPVVKVSTSPAKPPSSKPR
ncbi:glycoside hydrolase family 10 protein, partial [Cronbergia sp. UHCC 0137]|nr:glycoside hydrolase family 10 protein [Cronbergia sp. UHCC 0137]